MLKHSLYCCLALFGAALITTGRFSISCASRQGLVRQQAFRWPSRHRCNVAGAAAARCPGGRSPQVSSPRAASGGSACAARPSGRGLLEPRAAAPGPAGRRCTWRGIGLGLEGGREPETPPGPAAPFLAGTPPHCPGPGRPRPSYPSARGAGVVPAPAPRVCVSRRRPLPAGPLPAARARAGDALACLGPGSSRKSTLLPRRGPLTQSAELVDEMGAGKPARSAPPRGTSAAGAARRAVTAAGTGLGPRLRPGDGSCQSAWDFGPLRIPLCRCQ